MLSWGQRQQALLTVRIHSGMNGAPDSPVYQGLIREGPVGWLILNGGDLIKQLLIILPHNALPYPVIRLRRSETRRPSAACAAIGEVRQRWLLGDSLPGMNPASEQ